MRVRWLFLALALGLGGLFTFWHLNAGTVHEECAGNTTCEMSRRDADALGAYAVGLSCWHGVSATVAVVTEPPCKAYVADGTYIEWTAATGWSYNQGDGTYYFGVHKSPGVVVSGWQTVAGTPWRWIKSTTEPVVTDPGFLPLGKATVATGAVSSVVETVTRRFQPGTRWAVAAGVTRLLGSCPIAGRWPLFDADDVTTGEVAFATACNVLPEWWGATGDGVTLDGLALWGMVSGVNASTTPALTITFGPGRIYLITGGPNSPATPQFTFQGLQTLTKSDVEIVAYGAELKVPASYAWVNNDVEPRQEAHGLVVTGPRVKIRGGIWNGNLTSRDLRAGPSGGPWDGTEVGIRFGKLAGGYLVQDAVVKEWGTDGFYIHGAAGGAGTIRQTQVVRPRRHGMTIGTMNADEQGLVSKPIVIDGCTFLEAGQYPAEDQPVGSAGIQFEGALAGVTATMHVLNSQFANNWSWNITLSVPGYRHIVKNNLLLGVDETNFVAGELPGGIKLANGDQGGHSIQGNVFGNYGIYVASQDPTEATVVANNVFRGATRPVDMTGSAAPPKGWVFAGNSLPNASKDVEDGISGPERKVGYNAYKTPPEYAINRSVAAFATDTVDLTATPLFLQASTYLVIAKGNAGGGSYDVAAFYLLTWNGTALEGAWDLLPPNAAFSAATMEPDVTFTQMAGACGRKISRTGAVLTFDNSTCNVTSFYGVIVYALGRGDWGT